VSRLLVVGWDGGTWSFAGPLSDAGRLPTLASLRGEGAEGVLASVPNMNSAPAWSTIATGLNPGRHGIFYFDEPVEGSYRRTVLNAGRRSGASLWRLASLAGRRVIVVNVPISFPAEAVNGVQVSGLDAPFTSVPGFAHPEHLTRRYPDLFRDYIIEPGAQSAIRAGRVREAKDELLRAIDGWSSLTARLMRDEPWDLAFVVFTSSDIAQHFFWTEGGRDFIERVYEAQDAATGGLVQLAREQDPETNVMVLADHGGAANTRGPEFMPTWLEDQGLQARTRPSARSRALAAGFRLANRTLTRRQKLALARRLRRLRERAEAEARLEGVDWERTTAYADGRRDEVLVNLAGREPEGTVSEADYGRFVEELRERIQQIREIDTGRPVVASVVAREQAYRGPFVGRAPDLTIRWVLDGPFAGFRCESPELQARMRRISANPPLQTGGHHPEGMVVANGPNIRSAELTGSLEDVTPTVLAILGVPVPDELDGRPLECLKDVHAEVAASSGSVDTSRSAGTSGYTAEQEEEVRRRLEDLGYL
jgi:predicted AlkP superfamily phosphohydrolase/phosphomutase